MKNKILKIIKQIYENKYTNYIIICIISLLISLPFLKISLLGTGDTTLHMLRIIGLGKSIENSHFPYIITPFYCRNFGYATNLFYPQLTTYIPYILSLFTKSYESAMELFAVITIILSGITMYKFTQQITNNKTISLISSIIYLIFPYRFECIYERFAIGEFTALIFTPILFQGLYNLIKQDGSKHYLITIGAAGTILSHTITAVYSVVFCIIFILFNIKNFLKKDVIKKCIINAIFIILISMLFIVPLFEHRIATKYTIFDANRMQGTGENVYENSATLKQLLTDSGSNKTVSFTIGIPIIWFSILGFACYKKIDKKDKEWYSLFAILSIICLYMTTKLFPWQIMPKWLTMIQFSWRLLCFFNLFLAPICAVNIYTIYKNTNKKFGVVFLIICTLIVAISTSIRLNQFIVEKTENYEKYKSYESRVTENPIISHMSINREYLPQKSTKDRYAYIEQRTDNVYVLEGKAQITNENKEALNMTFEIQFYRANTVLELPFLYYLGYDINMDTGNEKVELEYVESENGFISISIPQDIEQVQITVEYKGTSLEKVSYLISAIGTIIFILYCIRFKINEKGR